MFSKTTYMLHSQKLEERRRREKKRNNTSNHLSFAFILRLIIFSAALLLTPSSQARWHLSMNGEANLHSFSLAIKVPLLNVHLYKHSFKEMDLPLFSTYIISHSPYVSTENVHFKYIIINISKKKLLMYMKHFNVKTCFLNSEMMWLIASKHTLLRCSDDTEASWFCSSHEQSMMQQRWPTANWTTPTRTGHDKPCHRLCINCGLDNSTWNWWTGVPWYTSDWQPVPTSGWKYARW